MNIGSSGIMSCAIHQISINAADLASPEPAGLTVGALSDTVTGWEGNEIW